MRALVLLILDVILSLALFVGIQACRGFFVTFGDVFSLSIWATMSAKDIWIFLGCMILSASCTS